jgi:hypothetical protein
MESKSKYHKRYDWSLIQKDHDDGMTWEQLKLNMELRLLQYAKQKNEVILFLEI